MDGLTTNGVLVMHPRHGFSQDSRPGLWREISVCGHVFTLRETRSSQQRGRTVGDSSHSNGALRRSANTCSTWPFNVLLTSRSGGLGV